MTAAAVRYVLWRLALVAALTVTGYIHAQLYLDGYRAIHVVGLMFLLQSSAAFAVAALLLVRAPALLLVGAAGIAAAALAGFLASRTIGVFGFTEHGLQPAPQALLSVVAEISTLTLLVPAAVHGIRNRPAATP